MKIFKNPATDLWTELSLRPTADAASLSDKVVTIFKDVAATGDQALETYTQQFDKTAFKVIDLNEELINQVSNALNNDLKASIQLAYDNIYTFHLAQKERPNIIETMPGVSCWRESRAIEKVGFYIPGGSAPLFSTLLMLGVPAKIAGCQEMVVCTPANADGVVHEAILYTAQLLGIKKVYAIGGIQAIAAMTIGTKTVPKVDKIFGPGNQYVTAAKQYAQTKGLAIDMPAGPSEVLVIADDQANPDFVAADLLSQAEHGPDSQVMLLATSEDMINATFKAIETQLSQLPRQQVATKALDNSKAICLPSIADCIAFSNVYAPEHLILNVTEAQSYIQLISSAGSVFLGSYSCESCGDYATGTNHTLPTNGYARAYSGVSVDSFVKKITFQSVTAAGIQKIGPAVECMAAAEGLLAHKNAVTIRLKTLQS